MVNSISIRVGIAAILMGVILGFVPAYTADLDEFGEGVSCGSPFIVSDDLTGSGLDSCEGASGLSTRRAWAFAFLGGGLVFLLAGITQQIKPSTPGPPDENEGPNRDRGYDDDPSSRFS